MCVLSPVHVFVVELGGGVWVSPCRLVYYLRIVLRLFPYKPVFARNVDLIYSPLFGREGISSTGEERSHFFLGDPFPGVICIFFNPSL